MRVNDALHLESWLRQEIHALRLSRLKANIISQNDKAS